MKTKTNQTLAPRARMLHTLADQVEFARKGMIEMLGPMYLAELESFAETLRPRFEAGELYGFRQDVGVSGDGEGEHRLERAIDAHFGLEVTRVTEDPKTWTGDEHAARAILALSPAADLVPDLDGYNHVAYAARECVLYDVLALARACRWYRPTKDEGPKVLRGRARRAA
jgi:hypothetical protein